MSVDGEDRDQMVNRKAEVRRASRANAARPTTMRGAVWVRPQPAGIIHQSPSQHRSWSLVFKQAPEGVPDNTFLCARLG